MYWKLFFTLCAGYFLMAHYSGYRVKLGQVVPTSCFLFTSLTVLSSSNTISILVGSPSGIYLYWKMLFFPFFFLFPLKKIPKNKQGLLVMLGFKQQCDAFANHPMSSLKWLTCRWNKNGKMKTYCEQAVFSQFHLLFKCNLIRWREWNYYSASTLSTIGTTRKWLWKFVDL